MALTPVERIKRANHRLSAAAAIRRTTAILLILKARHPESKHLTSSIVEELQIVIKDLKGLK